MWLGTIVSPLTRGYENFPRNVISGYVIHFFILLGTCQIFGRSGAAIYASTATIGKVPFYFNPSTLVDTLFAMYWAKLVLHNCSP